MLRSISSAPAFQNPHAALKGPRYSVITLVRCGRCSAVLSGLHLEASFAYRFQTEAFFAQVESLSVSAKRLAVSASAAASPEAL